VAILGPSLRHIEPLLPTAAGGINVSGDTAIETDVANAGTTVKIKAGGTAVETSVANAGTTAKAVSGGTGVETDVANAGTAVKPILVSGGTAVETDVANAGTTEFSPDQITGLECWLKADAIGLADGANVTTWEDSHTSNKDATGATGQTHETNEINGLPIVRFDGTDDRMSIALTNGDPTRTMFMVAKLGAGNSTGDGLVSWKENGGLDVTSTGTVRYRSNQAGGQTNFVGAGVPGNGVAFLAAVRWNSSSSADVFLDDGAALNLDPSDVYQDGLVSTLNLAARTSAGGVPCQVDIGEFLIYDSALGTTDYEAVRDYLLDKWLPAAPIVVNGDTALETDVTNAGTVTKTVSGGTGPETDVANAGTAVKPIIVAGDTATETDVANAGTVVKPIVVSGSTAPETDAAQAGAASKAVLGGTGAETDTAPPGTAVKPIIVLGGTASETDTAPAGTVSMGGGTTVSGDTATETDTALAGFVTKVALGGQAIEVDVALAGFTGPPPPATHPALGGDVTEFVRGGVFDETATGGSVSAHIRGGRVTQPIRGGNVSERLRGGSIDEFGRGATPTVERGGYFDETPTGGRIEFPIRGGDPRAVRGGSLPLPRGGVIVERVRGGRVLEPMRGGSVSELVRSGVFDETSTGGSIA
jgi:hypothetical protein